MYLSRGCAHIKVWGSRIDVSDWGIFGKVDAFCVVFGKDGVAECNVSGRGISRISRRR